MKTKIVLDTKTGKEYNSMIDACEALGFTYSTITSQLRGAAKIQKWNTLIYKNDAAPTLDMYKRSKLNEIKHSMVIDVNTNKIYNSSASASRELGLSPGSVRLALCGSRKRQQWNTLYQLKDLQITNTGYTTS